MCNIDFCDDRLKSSKNAMLGHFVEELWPNDNERLYIHILFSWKMPVSVNGWPAPAGQQWYYTQKV